MSDDIQEIEQEMKKVAQPLSTIDIDKESKYAAEKHDRYAETFFKNVVDYSKWITSIALVALTLIATIFRDTEGIKNSYFVGSLVLICFSIIFSMVIIYLVLKFWKRNYDYYYDMRLYYSILWALKNNLNLYSPEDCEKQKKVMLEKVAKSAGFTMPELYSGLLSGQIILFFLGMVCYIYGVNIQ